MKVQHQETAGICAPSLPVAPRSISIPQAWKEALELWLRWNHCYEHVTAEAFAASGDQRRLEDLMDEMDQVRRQALALTARLLADS